MSKNINPDIAIVIDVCHDTVYNPQYNRIKQGNVVAGNGVVLMSAPAVQKTLFNKLKSTAKNHNIDYQIITSGSSTGTNTQNYFLDATPSALISLATKYMHSSSYETVKINNRENQ